MGMGINHWEWEGMGLKKIFPLISKLRRTNSTFGDRSFAVAAARIWNSLPSSGSSLRSADLSTERFKLPLKTFLIV